MRTAPRTNRKRQSSLRSNSAALIDDLDHDDEATRRQAIQTLVNCENTPIPSIECWPEQRCSNLQLAAAKTLLREWGEAYIEFPETTEADLIQVLFVEQSFHRPKPRVRQTVKPSPKPCSESPAPPAPPQPAMATLLNAAMDRLNDAVKDTILDWKPELPDDGEPEEEIALQPLDRSQFAVEMFAKFEGMLEHLTETVAAPHTNLELANTESEVGRFLHELRWDALNVALELRAPEEARLSSAGQPANSHGIPAVTPGSPAHSDWAKKYRRMKALGY